MAVKNNIDVFYFEVLVPLYIYFDENGQMDKRDFLQLWKEIPEQNEVQFTISNINNLSASKFFSVFKIYISYINNSGGRINIQCVDKMSQLIYT